MAIDVADKKPTIHQNPETGLRYLLGADKVLFETGVVVPRKLFDECKNNGLAVHLESLSGLPEHAGFDFSYACTTGVLRRKKVNAGLVVHARTARRRQIEAAERTQKEAEEKAAVKNYVFSSVFLVTVVMALVGTGSAVMSAYHTSAFLVHGGKPVWTAVMTGAMLILFSATAFTAARYFLNERGAVKAFGVLFAAAGIAVIAYSMFSTLTVNFDQFKSRSDEKTVSAVENSEALAAHREQMRLIEEEIENVTVEITRLRGEADYWREQSWRRYDAIEQQLTVSAERQRTLQEQRLALVSETPGLAEVEAASQETIYGFLASLFKVKEDVMRFFVYVIPACLYDILAPFSLSVVLLLLDRRKTKMDKVADC